MSELRLPAGGRQHVYLRQQDSARYWRADADHWWCYCRSDTAPHWGSSMQEMRSPRSCVLSVADTTSTGELSLQFSILPMTDDTIVLSHLMLWFTICTGRYIFKIILSVLLVCWLSVFFVPELQCYCCHKCNRNLLLSSNFNSDQRDCYNARANPYTIVSYNPNPTEPHRSMRQTFSLKQILWPR